MSGSALLRVRCRGRAISNTSRSRDKDRISMTQNLRLARRSNQYKLVGRFTVLVLRGDATRWAGKGGLMCQQRSRLNGLGAALRRSHGRGSCARRAPKLTRAKPGVSLTAIPGQSPKTHGPDRSIDRPWRYTRQRLHGDSLLAEIHAHI